MNKNSIEQLTELQAELGYVRGEISTVAMLGLVGEAGEVLAETYGSENESKIIEKAILICSQIDGLKKRVRSGTNHHFIYLPDEKIDKFKSELGDAFYYLNILATNVGLTIFDLAQMAHDKVRAKQAAGGSSEDPKNN